MPHFDHTSLLIILVTGGGLEAYGTHYLRVFILVNVLEKVSVVDFLFVRVDLLQLFCIL
jgi:hypothetical protein